MDVTCPHCLDRLGRLDDFDLPGNPARPDMGHKMFHGPGGRTALCILPHSFGARLRRLREEAGFSSPGALADACGLGPAICYRLENGPAPNPRLSTLVVLARALGVSPAVLVGGCNPEAQEERR